VTVNVNPDTTRATTAINKLVSAYNSVITEINSQFNVAADGSGGGPLEADNSLRDIQSQLLAAISYSVPGNSGVVNLASIGVNFNNDGTLSVDNGKLSAALSSNYPAVQNLLQNTTNRRIFRPCCRTSTEPEREFSPWTRKASRTLRRT
jgi:flagellar hook-associated protein 2